MRATHRFGMAAVLLAGIGLAGCSKTAPPAVVIPQGTAPVVVQGITPPDPAKPVNPPAAATDDARRDKYDATVRSALNLLADQKYTEALGLLEAAQFISDTDEIRTQIERVKGLVTQKDTVEQTAANIQTVLKDGNAEEASKLASDALKQFGDRDAVRLSQLKRQADALSAVNFDDRDARKVRFVREGDAALNEKNLRAAAIAYEQAVQAGAADDVPKKLDELRGQLTRYDELRTQASELRRDPYRIEDAVAMLEDAQRSWDTLQVRQEIEDYKLALLKRRDRISVADFEVRGDVGIPLAGRAVAEELLPAFRTRFDVIERAQLAKVMDELKLDAGDLIEDDAARNDIGKLAKVRYLVLGSVSALSGVTVNARLVDVRTGLVTQTAKISGRTPEEAVKLLPELAKMLTMSDEDRIALEHQLAQKAEVEVAPAQAAPIPPPPPVPAEEQPPPPPVVFNPKPPAFGNLQPQDFDRLPLPPPPGQVAPPAPVVVFEQQDPFRNRLLQVTLQLGDNLFRRGQFREANRHFELALNLAPGEVDIRLRIDRCRPLLPPPPPPPIVVVQPIFVPPPVFIRPRVAVLNFFVNADPRIAPPGFGDWAADQFAGQFHPWYDVIDRSELFWYMGRLGLTVRDVMLNPAARFYLARALNVRYFVFGYIQQTASFDVTAQLVDAETGIRQGVAMIHVHDRQEMKWRMGELVRQLRQDPHQRDVFVREGREYERVLVDMRRLVAAGQPAEALVIGRPALQRRPHDIGLRTLIEQAERRGAEMALEENRRREAEARLANRLAMQRRQEELAREAEQARLRAEREARDRDDAARRAQERQRERAHERLLKEAAEARQAKNFALATQLYQSAIALNPSDDGYRQLAQVRALEEAAVRARAAEEKARLEDARRKETEAEAARLRAKLDQERKVREADELARRKAQEARDLASYTKFIDDAQDQLKGNKVDAAIATLLSAKQLRSTDEVNRLLGQAQERKAQAELAKKTAAERAAVEKKLAEEKAAREKSEAEAKLKQDKYSDALVAAQKAFSEKRYDEAAARYQEAEKLFRSQAVLNGLGQVREAQAKERALLEAEKKKKDEQDQRAARITKLLADGQASLAAKQFDKAVTTLTAAKQLEPTNVDVLTALSKAEQARDEAAAQARLQKDLQEKQARFQKLLVDARDKLKAKQFAAAVASANEALKLKPGDPDAAGLLKAAEQGRASAGDAAKIEAEAKKKTEAHQKLVGEGKQALAAKQYDAAAKSFQKALDVLPADTATLALLKDAERLRKEQADLAAKQQDEAARQAEVQKLVKQARTALTAKNLAGAEKAIDAAAKLAPKEPEVLRLQQDLQTARDGERGEAEAKKRQAAFDKLLATARQAYTGKRYDDALQALADADKLIPADKEAAALRQDVLKAKSDLTAGDAKKKTEFALQVNKAKQALAAKRFDEALLALSDADKLIPGDKEVQTLKQSAEKGKADLLAAGQEAEARKKKLAADFQAQVGKAKLALSAKRYDEALAALNDADKFVAGDKEVQSLRQIAEKGKAELIAAGQEAEAKKKRLAEYGLQINRAKQALALKRVPEALQALNEADKLNPGAPETAALRRDIEKLRLDAEAEAKKKQDDLKRQAAFNQLMNQGQQAMTAKRFDDAVKSYSAAVQLMPADPNAKRALTEAQNALAASKVPPKPKGPTPQEEYAKAMQTAAVAEKQNRFEDAIRAYQDALKAQPNDAKASAAMRNAQYQDHMADGNQALKTKRFPDAARAFEAALKIMPNDAAATNGLKQAKAGK